jgi:hypothetical protein
MACGPDYYCGVSCCWVNKNHRSGEWIWTQHATPPQDNKFLEFVRFKYSTSFRDTDGLLGGHCIPGSVSGAVSFSCDELNQQKWPAQFKWGEQALYFFISVDNNSVFSYPAPAFPRSQP